MNKLLLSVALLSVVLLPVFLLPVLAPAQEPAYVDRGMKAVVQVAIVCRHVDATSKRWAAVLGVDPPQIRTTKPGHEVKVMFRGRPSEGQAKLAFIRLGPVTLDLIEPVGGNASWKERSVRLLRFWGINAHSRMRTATPSCITQIVPGARSRSDQPPIRAALSPCPNRAARRL